MSARMAAESFAARIAPRASTGWLTAAVAIVRPAAVMPWVRPGGVVGGVAFDEVVEPGGNADAMRLSSEALSRRGGSVSAARFCINALVSLTVPGTVDVDCARVGAAGLATAFGVAAWEAAAVAATVAGVAIATVFGAAAPRIACCAAACAFVAAGTAPDCASALAAAYVECEVGGEVFWGVGRDANILTASLKAVVSAVNRATR